MQQRRVIRLLLLVALNLVIFLCFAWSTTVSQQPVALAHAFVIGSEPVDGSTVNTAPKVVRIFFDAPISAASAANVYTPDEHIVNAAHSRISSANPRELDTPLQSPATLPQGSYTVRWTALSNMDGHTSQGVIGFNVGQSSVGLPGETILGPGTSNIFPRLDLMGILAVAWEWLVLMALTFWVGILVSEGFILPGVERTANLLTHTKKQTQPLQWVCLTALLVGEIITLILRTAQLSQALDGSGINIAVMGQILTQTTYGYLWLVRLALIACAIGLLWWTTRYGGKTHRLRRSRSKSKFAQVRQRITQEHSPVKTAPLAAEPIGQEHSVWPRYTIILCLALAALILLTIALTADATQLAQAHISSIIFDWLYLAARCIWLGGLTYLGYVLVPLLPMVDPDHNAGVLTTLLRRYQPLMLGAIGVLLVCGLYEAESSLSNAQQLLSDPYGRTLLVECILIVVMILLSGVALFILRPKLTRQAVLLPVVNAELPARRARQSALGQTAHRLKLLLSVVSWLGAVVLLCAALMAFFAPPVVFPHIDYSQNTSSASNSTTPLTLQTQQVGDLSLTLQVVPGRANTANTVLVTIVDSKSGQLVTNAQVQMSINMEIMDMGTTTTSLRGGNPTYVATFDKQTTFSMAGQWKIRLRIQRPAQPPQQVTFTVTMGSH